MVEDKSLVSSFLDINKRDFFTEENYFRLALMMQVSYTSSVINFASIDSDFTYDKETLDYCKTLNTGRGYSFLKQDYKTKDYETNDIFLIGEAAGMMSYLLGALNYAGKKCLHVFITNVREKQTDFLALFKSFSEVDGFYLYPGDINFDDIEFEIEKVIRKKGKRNIDVFYTCGMESKLTACILDQFSIANLNNIRKMNISHYFTVAKDYSYFLEREYKNIHYYGGLSDTGINYLIIQSIGSFTPFDYINMTATFDMDELKLKLKSPNLYWYAIDFDCQILMNHLFKFTNVTYIGDDTIFTYFLNIQHTSDYQKLKRFIMDEDFDFNKELHPGDKLNLTNEDNINVVENICFSELPISKYPKEFTYLYDDIRDKEIISFDPWTKLINKEDSVSNDGDCFIFGTSEKIFPFVNGFLKTHRPLSLSLFVNCKKYLDLQYYEKLFEHGYISHLIKNPFEEFSMENVFKEIDDFLNVCPERHKTFIFIYDKMQLRMVSYVLNYLKKKNFDNISICSPEESIYSYFSKEQAKHIFKFDYDEILYIKAVDKLTDYLEKHSLSFVGSSDFANRAYKDLSLHCLTPITYYYDNKNDSLISFDNSIAKRKRSINEIECADLFVFSNANVNRVIMDMETIHEKYPDALLLFYNKWHSVMYLYKRFNSDSIVDKIISLDEENLWIDFFLKSKNK